VIDNVDTTLWTIWEALRLSFSPEIGLKDAGAIIMRD
jgi:hypothetical protein